MRPTPWMRRLIDLCWSLFDWAPFRIITAGLTQALLNKPLLDCAALNIEAESVGCRLGVIDRLPTKGASDF